MDLKNALKEKDKKGSSDPENINKHKKPMQLRDIESRSSSNHKKFNETYKELFVEQKELLEHYVSSFEDNGLKLKIYLNEELARIKNKINNYMESDEVSEQEIMKNKLLEVLELIDGYKNQYITKEILEQILKLQTMVKEIENNE